MKSIELTKSQANELYCILDDEVGEKEEELQSRRVLRLDGERNKAMKGLSKRDAELLTDYKRDIRILNKLAKLTDWPENIVSTDTF